MLVILLLLGSPVRVWFDYGEEITIKISYLCFTLFSVPAKPKKKKRGRKKSPAKAEESGGGQSGTNTSAETVKEQKSASPQGGEKKPDKAQKKEKLTLDEILELVKMVVDSLGKPLKKLLKRMRISHLRVNIICGGEDAAKAAIRFGTTNIAVGNALGWIDTFFTLKTPDDIYIGVDFQSEETLTEASCVIKLSPLAALEFVLAFGGRALKNYSKGEKVRSAVAKLRA